MADCLQFLDVLDSEGPQFILSHDPDGGDDEGGEDEDGRKFHGPDWFLHHQGTDPGHRYFHDQSDEAGGQTEQE